MTTPTASTTPVSFHVYDGEQLVRRAVFTHDSVKIGRSTTADLCLEDASLSRMHAVVEVDGPTGGMVIDLGSAAGTYLNGEKVARARIHSGDELTVGRFSLVVNFGEAVGDLQSGNAPPPRVAEPSPLALGGAAPAAAANLPPEPEPEPEPEQVTGLCVVRPGTALVLRSRRTGELRAVRTSGHVMAWPWLHTASELDLTSISVHAAASGEGAALTADGLRVDLTLRLTLRPRRDDAVVRDIVDRFGMPPRPSQVAQRVVLGLSPALAAALAEVPHISLLPGVSLHMPVASAHGYDLESAEVLHVGEAVPDPAGGYRGGALDLGDVRFEGRPVARPNPGATRPRKVFSWGGPSSAPTWDQADTSQRVVIGWFLLLSGLPAGGLMAAASEAGRIMLGQAIFLFFLCALINVQLHLRTYWTWPTLVVALLSSASAANALVLPVASSAELLTSGSEGPTLASLTRTLLALCGVWFVAVLGLGRNRPARPRPR